MRMTRLGVKMNDKSCVYV